MIQIEAIQITEFRGIRSLVLQPKCKSFAVWGPNGSGKSGVVDAVDFALTGSISRLSGQGTGSMSARTHGPHVHKRENPEEAKVELTIRDAATGKTSILTRCAKTPQFFTLKPDTPQMRAAINQMQQHPEITLSRREIIKFILIEPSRRSEQLQALLKLDRFDQARKLLIAARTKASDEHKNAERELAAAESGIKAHLKVDLISTATTITAINARRETLGLNPLTQITPETDLSTGIASRSTGPDISKPTAIREVEDLQSRINDYTSLTAASQQLTAALNDLSTDPTLLLALQHRSLLDAGISLVTEAVCPLCDQPWDNVDALKNHLQEKLARSQAAKDLQTRIKMDSTALVTELRSFSDLVKRVQRWAAACTLLEPQHQLDLWYRNLTELAGTLNTIEGAANQQGRIASNILRTPSEVINGLTDLHVALEAIPDQTEAVAAHSFLTVAQDRWMRLYLARLSHKKATSAKNIAALVYDTYCAVSDNAMSTLYKSIENDFSGYYRRINSDDESSFTAQLSPSSGKLEFKVDFHGYGMYPPAAYHSEGHQDGMGVCLYLALMKQTLGDEFRLVVLDDVVMSVDRDHRRQFCELLKDEFPDVQFIITTHDEVWARQMRSSGLISGKSQARFYGWTVDDGPLYEPGHDVWDRISTHLSENDVPGAAHKLRRYLESAMAEIAEGLRAAVSYKSDPSYDLGELQSAVNHRHSELLKKALESARSWNSPDSKQRVEDLMNQRSKALESQGKESWAINKQVHNNSTFAVLRLAGTA